MIPTPKSRRTWPALDALPGDVADTIVRRAVNGIAHLQERAMPAPGGDPDEMRATALEEARRLEMVAAQLVDAASQAYRRAAELRLAAEGVRVVGEGGGGNGNGREEAA